MKALKKRLHTQLASLCDEDFSLEACPPGRDLPLHLSEHFQLHHCEWLGRKYLMAVESEGWEQGSPKEYRSQAAMMAKLLGKPVVLVLPALTASVRNRLVGMKIPFIVPGTQIFLPDAWMDLQEKYPGGGAASGEHRLTPTAQLFLLYHLQKSELHQTPGKIVAEKLGCSEAMVSKARSELEEAKLCELDRVGRTIHLVFHASGRALWEMAAPLLSSPVRDQVWIAPSSIHLKLLDAGITALSRSTMLADDPLPTRCMHKPAFRRHLERGDLKVCPDADQAIARLETWSYDPETLALNDQVDPLSLWLSLRHDPDERVQGQLQTLLEDVSWL